MLYSLRTAAGVDGGALNDSVGWGVLSLSQLEGRRGWRDVPPAWFTCNQHVARLQGLGVLIRRVMVHAASAGCSLRGLWQMGPGRGHRSPCRDVRPRVGCGWVQVRVRSIWYWEK